MRGGSAFALVAATLLATGGAPALAQEVPIQVEFRDGTKIPLQDWTLSYEYAIWKKGTPASLAQPRNRESRLLFEDKDELPLSGGVLEFQYGSRSSSRFVDGEMKRVEIEQPTGFTLVTADGRRREFESPDPPHRDRLTGDEDKDRQVQPRGLDLRGATLTGTRRSFCLFSYTALVECSDEPAQQVVRIVFP
jgi:hypothetical protein